MCVRFTTEYITLLKSAISEATAEHEEMRSSTGLGRSEIAMIFRYFALSAEFEVVVHLASGTD